MYVQQSVYTYTVQQYSNSNTCTTKTRQYQNVKQPLPQHPLRGSIPYHSSQNPRWTQKPTYTPIFTHQIRSWLLYPRKEATTAVVAVVGDLYHSEGKSPHRAERSCFSTRQGSTLNLGPPWPMTAQVITSPSYHKSFSEADEYEFCAYVLRSKKLANQVDAVIAIS